MIQLDNLTIDLLYLFAYTMGSIGFLLSAGVVAVSFLYSLVYAASTIIRRE